MDADSEFAGSAHCDETCPEQEKAVGPESQTPFTKEDIVSLIYSYLKIQNNKSLLPMTII